MEEKTVAKNRIKYCCQKCDYNTCNHFDYLKHCETKKHKLRQMEMSETQKIASLTAYSCQNCEKTFISHSGFWKHSKKCPQKCPKPDQGGVGLAQFLDYLKIKEAASEKREQQKHEAELLRDKQQHEAELQRNKQNENLFKLVIDLCKNNQILNTTNNINNNSNNSYIDNSENTYNTFNLQLFLNDTCKDAINLSDFIKGVTVNNEEIERIGALGYVNGLSDVILRNLKDLGVEKRPIHCTDSKRQIMYIKENNEWTKEDDNLSHIQYLIDSIQRINLRQLAEWRRMHPACLTSNSMYTDKYNNMSQELMGGDCAKIKVAAKDEKIKGKICKEMMIEKHLYFNSFVKK